MKKFRVLILVASAGALCGQLPPPQNQAPPPPVFTFPQLRATPQAPQPPQPEQPPAKEKAKKDAPAAGKGTAAEEPPPPLSRARRAGLASLRPGWC